MRNPLLRPLGVVLAALFIASVGVSSQAAGEEVVMFKDPNCGCCGKWAAHMRENGFQVQEVASTAMAEIKRSVGVTPQLSSCHTARVGGYVVEGHVPADDVRRLLAQRPEIVGLSAPGMPLGSPGMEGPYQAESYDVIGFDEKGSTSVFATH